MIAHKTEIIAGVIMTLLILGCVIENWRDKRIRRRDDEPLPVWFLAIAVSAVVFLVAVYAPYVQAHDHARPELNSWYESLRSGKGPCCDGSDAKRLDDVDWETRDGHYRARLEGQWVDVPDEAVVGGPNRAGPTMVWPYYQDGKPAVRCFMPGSMT